MNTAIDLNEVFGGASKYFNLQSLQAGEQLLLTISFVEQHSFTDTKKLVLTVAEDSRKLVLSQTNLKYLLSALGRDTTAWIGERIMLSVGRSSYGSRMLRVNRTPVTTEQVLTELSERIQ